MMHRILSTRIASEQALVMARDRTRQVGDVFGLDALQRTRFITAVSEIARNAVQFAGGGAIEFHLRPATVEEPQALVARIVDEGPGIARLDEILEGRFLAQGRPVLGITGSRRLVDRFAIETHAGQGTVVTLEMRLPVAVAPINAKRLGELVERLARRKEQTPTEELEQQNREMLVALEALRARQVELQQADERKDEFLAMLAHELRNPLSAIRTALEVLKRKNNATAAEVQNLGSIISRQTEQLASLVNDLLDVSRVTQGKIDLSMEALSLRELIEHALEMSQSLIDQRAHSVTLDLPAEEIFVYADRVRFKQVLGNLLHNAARYTPAHGKIHIAVTRQDDTAVVAITDSGIGIEAEMLPRVFDLFAQAKTGLSRQDAGLGVGLTVVQRMLREHGGEVQVASAGLGLGSTFTIRVPILHAVEPAAAPEEAGAPAVTGLRILLIDDNFDAADVLRQILEMLGHSVEMAHTGEKGVTDAARMQPDAVIVDIGLPGMNGFEVARVLRDHPATRSASLIALSGYSVSSMKNPQGTEDFDLYLEKPVAIDVLEAALEDVAPRKAERLAAES
jgi:signal transduction histidine kinase/ActR/RegA family two-component response regulator